MPPKRVFVDTNIIIESFRTGCWRTICQQFNVETVDKCVEEALGGDLCAPGRIDVDPELLQRGLAACHQVNREGLAAFVLEHPECQGLDEGELYLLAWLYPRNLLQEVLVLVSTADKAAIVATAELDGIDSLISLESLVLDAGIDTRRLGRLADHFREAWLNSIKTKIRLGVIP